MNYKKTKEDLLNNELFEGIQEKGVLLFSRKGDAYRFCFTAQDGNTCMMNSQQALTLFKAEKEEKGEKVSDAFYKMYEKAKSESGIVKVSKQKSKNVQEALSALNFLKNTAQTASDKEYIETVRNVVSWDSLPLFYLRKISKIEFLNKNVIEDLKIIIPENYLNTLVKKDNAIGSEPETILLAEELL